MAYRSIGVRTFVNGVTYHHGTAVVGTVSDDPSLSWVHSSTMYNRRDSTTLVYAVRNGAARCRQGVSSAALATHCLGGGNATGAEEIAVH
jgi:hypothetical protein